MKPPKVHHHKKLKAYYTKRGRIWHVEAGTQTHQFKSIEAMVESFPGLLEVEAIKNSVERRALSKPPVQIKRQSNENENTLSKTTECYYCSGVGEVIAGIACPNCGGKGTIKVTTRGF